MEALKFTLIKNKEQYDEYCRQLESLLHSGEDSIQAQEEIELLTLLIETYDREYSIFRRKDPVALLKLFMKEHQLRQKDIAEIAGVGKSYISEILNYRKTMSKQVIRKLANHFKVRQEAFNRSYRLMKE